MKTCFLSHFFDTATWKIISKKISFCLWCRNFIWVKSVTFLFNNAFDHSGCLTEAHYLILLAGTPTNITFCNKYLWMGLTGHSNTCICEVVLHVYLYFISYRLSFLTICSCTNHLNLSYTAACNQATHYYVTPLKFLAPLQKEWRELQSFRCKFLIALKAKFCCWLPRLTLDSALAVAGIKKVKTIR